MNKTIKISKAGITQINISKIIIMQSVVVNTMYVVSKFSSNPYKTKKMIRND